MASSLRFITSNLLSRSVMPFHPRFLSHNASPQSSTTMPTDEFFDQSWLRMQMSLWPEISSMSFHMEKTDEGRSLTLNIPGVEMMKTNEGHICVSMNMPGLKKEDMKACVEHNTLFLQGKTNNECYLGGIKLTRKTHGFMKEEMEDGMLKITLPNKTNFFSFWKKDIIAKLHDHSPYSDMFSDLSIIGKGFCPAIALLSPINSFSIYKEETAKSLLIKMSMPGPEKMELTTQGVRVSLNMPGLKIEDVKSFFDYDTFFVEGKTNKEHYITGIRLPEGSIHKKHNMIKRKMRNGTFHATLPYVEDTHRVEID